MTYAGLSMSSEVIAQAEALIRADPIATDAMLGPVWLHQVATAYALLGEHEGALQYANSLMSIPARFSLEMLELDPLWEEPRQHPLYREILWERRGS